MARTRTEPEASDEAVPPPAEPHDNRFFTWMRSLGIPRRPGWVGGVCAGIADRLGIDPLIVRGVVVVVAVLGGPALILYAAAWLLLPDLTNRIHLEDVFRGRVESPIAGIGALVLLSMLPVAQGFWFLGAGYWGEPHWGDSLGRALWTTLVLAGVVVFIVWVARRAGASTHPTVIPATTDGKPDTIPEPPAPPAPAADASTEDFAAWRAQQAEWKAENNAYRKQQANEASRIAREQARAASDRQRAEYRAQRERSRPNTLFSVVVIGLAIVGGALTTIGLGGGTPGNAAIAAGLAAALGIIGLGIFVNGVRGKRAGGANFFTVPLIVALVVAATLPQVPQVRLTGNAYLAPSLESVSSRLPFIVGTGDVVLDLTELYDGEPTTLESPSIDLAVFSGDITVIVPADEYAYVGASVRHGAISAAAGDNRPPEAGGQNASLIQRYSLDGDTEWSEARRSVYVQAWAGDGDITVIREEAATTGDSE